MMSSVHPGRRRRNGLTLVETLLAMSITAMVGAGIATMMNVLGRDVGLQYEARAVLVRTNSAQARFSAYVAPARCILEADEGRLVLWLEDSRESKTVHASEIRWIHHDPATNQVLVDFVAFPDTWSESAKSLADTEYRSTSSWEDVRSAFANLGLLATAPLMDEVAVLKFSTPDVAGTDPRLVQADLQFVTSDGDVAAQVCDSIRVLRLPVN